MSLALTYAFKFAHVDRCSSLSQTLIIFEVILMTQCFAAVAFFPRASWRHRHSSGGMIFLAQSLMRPAVGAVAGLELFDRVMWNRSAVQMWKLNDHDKV